MGGEGIPSFAPMASSGTDLNVIRRKLRLLADRERAKVFRRFFKAGRGEYGEGDQFLGVQVPPLRKLAKENQGLAWSALRTLMVSRWHEERFLALLILVRKFLQASEPGDQERCFCFYIRHMGRVNNWDLVDVSAEHVLGAYLLQRDRSSIFKWARSENIWHRRIAMMTTFHFVKRSDFSDTLRLAKIFLKDDHDLIHKAAGWMLREIGKRDLKREEAFLEKHAASMPRTMLRYAIERFPPSKRRRYMSRKKG